MRPWKAKGEFNIYIQLWGQSCVNAAGTNLWHAARASSTGARGSHRPPGAASRWGSGGAPTETRLLELLQLLCGREGGRLGKGGVRTAQGSTLASSRRLQRVDGHTSNLV